MEIGKSRHVGIYLKTKMTELAKRLALESDRKGRIKNEY